MADAEDKEKAEKVAAARKRYEQLKKQKAKKATGTTKKPSKDEKSEPSASAPTEPTTTTQEGDDEANEEEDAAGETSRDAVVDDEPDADPVGDVPVEDTSTRQPSLSLQSQMRSSSFKRATGILSPVSASGGLKSPPLPPLSTDGDSVQDIYRKQAARIEALEIENKRLEKEVEDQETSRAKMEEELEDLRESRADVVAITTPTSGKGGDIDKLKMEISTLQRQNTQLSQQVKDRRRPSGNIPLASSTADDLNTQLADKTSSIEALQLEISNLRHSLSESQASATTLKGRVTELEASLKAAEDASETAQRDVVDMRARLESTANPSNDSSASSTADANRIALLTSDLHTAQRTATQAQTRATNLEKKIETLSTLHRESEARQHAQFAARSKEMERLRTEASEMRKKVSSVSNENARLRERRARGDSISSLGNRPPTSEGVESSGSGDFALQARVRELEAENSDLRRGVWRDRRRELQEAPPGEEDSAIASPNGAGFDDVDLSTPTSYRRKSTPYNALGFTNIINTFTGRDNASSAARGYSFGGGSGSRRGSRGHPSQSGFMSRSSGELNEFDDGDGDFNFDEDAFRAAQEEQAKQRLERVKEVKRGLNDWRGWKVDLVDLRGGSAAGVFDV